MIFRLGNTSLRRLQGIHPKLEDIVLGAIKIVGVDFSVIEGMRSIETQEQYVLRGSSKTMNSRHLTGHAVDLAPWVADVCWDDNGNFELIRDAMMESAQLHGVQLDWGGDWSSLVDKAHFELKWQEYPIK